jgi:hypothetical protein
MNINLQLTSSQVNFIGRESNGERLTVDNL